MEYTPDAVMEHVGGGDLELGDAEKKRTAQTIADGANSYQRWLESRDIRELNETVPVTVNGRERTVKSKTTKPISPAASK